MLRFYLPTKALINYSVTDWRMMKAQKNDMRIIPLWLRDEIKPDQALTLFSAC